MKFYTDYPFVMLGDIAGEKAPIREIELVSYDYDKRVVARFKKEDDTFLFVNIKAGYIMNKKMDFELWCDNKNKPDWDKMQVVFNTLPETDYDEMPKGCDWI